MKVNIKPLSINKAFKGRRKRTTEYNNYRTNVKILLKPSLVIPEGKLCIRLIFGLSSKGFDWDNPIKPIQDIISEYYGFNDNRIYRGIVDKVIVPKGKEFIDFEITKLDKT